MQAQLHTWLLRGCSNLAAHAQQCVHGPFTPSIARFSTIIHDFNNNHGCEYSCSHVISIGLLALISSETLVCSANVHLDAHMTVLINSRLVAPMSFSP